MNMQKFLEALGYEEEPLGVFYTDEEPQSGFSPKPGDLPTAEAEARGEVDLGTIFDNWSCVLGHVWLARKKGTAAYFDRDRFGCLGAAYYLGYLKPQLDGIAHYVSSGIPGVMEGERYLESPEAFRQYNRYLDPRPAPARFCVFKPLGRFIDQEQPEVVIFFARPEVLCGLHFLATFVTNDVEAVVSPFGSDCSYILTWPLKFLSQGKLKAVLGGFDPSARKFHRPDELSFAVPWEMFGRMLTRWPESFLTTHTWATVKRKIKRSKKAWGEVNN